MKVRYEDHMGSDLKVVNMARVSFDKRSEYNYDIEGTNHRLSIQDKSLIQFLARGCTSGDWDKTLYALQAEMVYGDSLDEARHMVNHIRRMPPHWTPFAHCQVTLHLKVPIFVARQLDKHQVGFVKSEVSRRYITSEPEFYRPSLGEGKGHAWRKAATDVKQGSSDELVDFSVWGQELDLGGYEALKVYKALLEEGCCPEQARMVLPQSMYTEFFLTGSLYGWANMFIQRSDPHAQKETREVAKQISEIIEPLFPESWKALTQ